jgi:hypothetical protein
VGQPAAHYRPYDLTDYDWEIRTDDPGVTFSPQGPSTDSLFNGIGVTYTDPLTGAQDRLTPETTSTLEDTSTDEPVERRTASTTGMRSRSRRRRSRRRRLLLGVAALADRNRPKTPGTITATGYIRDRAGNPQPVWKVRAGDTIAITNFPTTPSG